MSERDDDAVGRTREVADVPDALASMRLLDLLGHPASQIRAGDALPPLAHWLHFGGVEPLAECGPDGHPRRGDFLPALPYLPRRMWAGSRVRFHAPLRAGEPASKRSTVVSLAHKNGRSGPLAFAVLRHEVADRGGRALVTEDQTLVFREAPKEPVQRTGAPDGGSDDPAPPWQRRVEPDLVMLFRYSALTFNSHRIHYDADYVREVEGYAAPVIHGPLTATLLLDLALRHANGRTPETFAFTARAPLVLGDAIELRGGPDGHLEALTGGATAMEATFTLSPT